MWYQLFFVWEKNMINILDEIFMEIPIGLKISERQRKAIDNLDLSNRRTVIKMLMEQQGISEDRSAYKVAENDVGVTKSDGYYSATNQPTQDPSYIFSSDMRERLGHIESRNRYTIENKIGALGRYQFTKTSLEDIGYRDHQGRWTGKNGIHSKEDFFNNPQIQEKALDEYLKKQDRYLKYVKAYDYLDVPIHGVEADFKISETGLLAAAHREGAKIVRNYLNALEKNSKGQYYMDYDKLSPEKRSTYKHIETRLRQFEK